MVRPDSRSRARHRGVPVFGHYPQGRGPVPCRQGPGGLQAQGNRHHPGAGLRGGRQGQGTAWIRQQDDVHVQPGVQHAVRTSRQTCSGHQAGRTFRNLRREMRETRGQFIQLQAPVLHGDFLLLRRAGMDSAQPDEEGPEEEDRPEHVPVLLDG